MPGRVWYCCMLACLPAVWSAAAHGEVRCQGEGCVASQLGDDTFVAGGEIRIDDELPGDVLAAGGRVELAGSIGGDAVVAGGGIEIASAVADDVYAAGGRVELSGPVGGSARLGGGEIVIERGARIEGGVSLGGGHALIEGFVGRYLQGGAGKFRLNGSVDGDVDVGAGELEIGPEARIEGRLRYRSEHEARIDPAARIAGGVERVEFTRDWQSRVTQVARPFAWFMSALWLLGSALLGILLLIAWPAFTARAARAARSQSLQSAMLGFAFVVAVPVLVVLLFVTVIGIPLGIATLLGYLITLIIGWLLTAIALGDLAVERLAPARSERLGSRVLAFLLAFVLITLALKIPWLGSILRLVVLVLGTGALVLALYRSWSQPAAA